MSGTVEPGYVGHCDLVIPQGGDFAMPVRVMVTTDGGTTSSLLDTTGYTAAFAVRDEDYDGDVVASGDTTNGRVVVGYTPSKWVAATAYAVGAQVVPTTLNGYVYVCTVAGTSGGAQPTWPTTINNTVVDNTATWKCLKVDTSVANLMVQLPASYTAALTDFGLGVFTLQMYDTYGVTYCWIDGTARLRREAF